MCDRQHRESLAPSPACTASEQCQTEAAEARPQSGRPGEEREKTSYQNLNSLQEWICVLLIKNQELRMSLMDSATNHKSAETDQ
jgi:hypothetical protein